MKTNESRRRPPEFIRDADAGQRNILVPDILRNNRSVDEALWKGSRTAPPVQRVGAVVIGLLLILCGISSAMTATRHHYLFEIVLTLAFVGAGIKVASNGLRRSSPKPNEDKPEA